MNIVLVKVIFALLTFITTNSSIPQTVKDQSINLVSQTAISAPQTLSGTCSVQSSDIALKEVVVDQSKVIGAREEARKVQIQKEVDLFRIITTDPDNLQLGMDLCDVNTHYWGKLDSFDQACKTFNAKYR